MAWSGRPGSGWCNPGDGPRHRCPECRRRTAPSSWAGPARGTPGCRTSRLDFTPSSGTELQSEYLIPREHTVEAWPHRRDPGPDRAAATDFRAAYGGRDELWLRPQLRRDSLAIHFTWVDDEAAVTALLPAIEDRLAPFAARPHWGKVFTDRVFTGGPAAVSEHYPGCVTSANCGANTPDPESSPTVVDRYAPPGRCLGGDSLRPPDNS